MGIIREHGLAGGGSPAGNHPIVGGHHFGEGRLGRHEAIDQCDFFDQFHIQTVELAGKQLFELCQADVRLHHFQQQALDLGLGLRQSQIARHAAEQDDVFQPPGLGLIAEQLAFPRHLPAEIIIGALTIRQAGFQCRRRELRDFSIEIAAPIHAAKKPVDFQHGVAAVEELRGLTAAEQPHEQHLQAAIGGMAIAHAPVQFDFFARLDVRHAMLIAPDLCPGRIHQQTVSGQTSLLTQKHCGRRVRFSASAQGMSLRSNRHSASARPATVNPNNTSTSGRRQTCSSRIACGV